MEPKSMYAPVTVEVTKSRNGYPRDVFHAETLDTQSETLDYAKLTGGKIVLLRKRDGWHFWEQVRETFLPQPLTLDDFNFNEDEEERAFVVRTKKQLRDVVDATEFSANLLANMRAKYDEDEDEPALVDVLPSVNEAVENLELDEFAIAMVDHDTNEIALYGIFNSDDAHWHDSDVWEYCYAVV